MTWFGWFLTVDLILSIGFNIASNDKRQPRTTNEMALGVIEVIALIVGILAVGTGSL